MPTRDRVGLHHQFRPAVTTEHASERDDDRPVVGLKARTRDLALQDHELMAQHKKLDILGTIPPPARDQQIDHEPDETVETGHAPILAAFESCRETPGQRGERVFGTHRFPPLFYLRSITPAVLAVID
jgi:hypothetical protein